MASAGDLDVGISNACLSEAAEGGGDQEKVNGGAVLVYRSR